MTHIGSSLTKAQSIQHPAPSGTYLEVIQDPSTIQQQVAMVLKLPRLLAGHLLSQLYRPLALVFLPVTANDFSIEGHVFLQLERAAHLVEILPDIRRVGKVPRPIRVLSGCQV